MTESTATVSVTITTTLDGASVTKTASVAVSPDETSVWAYGFICDVVGELVKGLTAKDEKK